MLFTAVKLALIANKAAKKRGIDTSPDGLKKIAQEKYSELLDKANGR